LKLVQGVGLENCDCFFMLFKLLFVVDDRAKAVFDVPLVLSLAIKRVKEVFLSIICMREQVVCKVSF